LSNNFNYSDSGINIDFGLRYDIDLSQIYFNDSFEQIEKSNSYLYTDYGNLSNEWVKSESFKVENNKRNIIVLKRLIIIVSDYHFTLSDLTNNDTNSLVDIVCDELDLEVDEIVGFLNDYNIDYKSNYEIMTTRGYSQGDYNQIVINTKEFKEAVGVDFDSNTYQKIFDNLFWNSPISGTIIINDIELCEELFFDDYYEFFDDDSKNRIISKILDIAKNDSRFELIDLKVLRSELENTIPSSLEHI
ncbi:MAG: hypothetical protein U9Q66_00420, partial [Patescibacteria group bacterium]|nr:hypothetical protein [Patescibacteria group bacterium]